MRNAFGLFLFLAFVFSLGVSPVKASPNNDVVIVRIFLGPAEVTVSEGDTLTLRQGWIARNSGFVRLYLHQSQTSFTLTNEGVIWLAVGPEEAAEYWGLIAARPDFPECRGDEEAGAQWNFPLPALEPGDYELNFNVTHYAPLTDGCDWDGDGHIDFYAGANRHIVIHVVPD